MRAKEAHNKATPTGRRRPILPLRPDDASYNEHDSNQSNGYAQVPTSLENDSDHDNNQGDDTARRKMTSPPDRDDNVERNQSDNIQALNGRPGPRYHDYDQDPISHGKGEGSREGKTTGGGGAFTQPRR